MGQQPYYSTVERLEAILAALPDDLMLDLKAATGRPGYGPRMLFRAYVATFILNSSSISAALRTIADNPNLANAIGGAPSKYALSRFISKLKDTDLLQQVMSMVADALREFLPNLGNYVALDSTDIKAWARRTTGSDPDAGTSVKASTHGFKQFWYGYKTHLIADPIYEIPLGAYVTAANNSDNRQVEPSMVFAAPFSPAYVLADAGYDSHNNRAIVEAHNAIPIIKRNPRGRTIEPDSAEWKEIYAHRSGIERMFGRLKGFRRLNRLTMRGLDKVTIHCVTAVLTAMVWALAALLLGPRRPYSLCGVASLTISFKPRSRFSPGRKSVATLTRKRNSPTLFASTSNVKTAGSPTARRLAFF